MSEDEVAVAHPIVIPVVPGGTRWIKVTSPHPGQIIKVKKSNDLSVFYVQEKPGTSQGRVNGTHRSGRVDFLRDYQPFTKRDWQAADKLMASLEQATTDATVEAETEQPVETNGFTTVITDERAQTQADLDAWGIPGVLVHEDLSPDSGEAGADIAVPDEVAQSGSPDQGEEVQAEAEATPRRMLAADIPDQEQGEIIELWRSDEAVTDIAATYNTTPGVIFNVVSTLAPEEYLLRRVVDQLKRNDGPIPAYRISQWMHLKKPEVEELCTSEAAQKVLRYTVETNDPARPWIKTPMVELLPSPSTETPPEAPAEPTVQPESEAPVATPVKNAAVAAPDLPQTTQFVITNPETQETPVTDTQTETPVQSRPDRPLRNWHVVIRTTVTDRVAATDIASAIEAAKAKYTQPAEVVGVMEE